MDSEPAATSKQRRSSIFSVDHYQRDAGKSSTSCVLDLRLSAIKSKLHREAYENTYKMEPRKRFDIKEAKKFVNEILEENFFEVKYDPLQMVHLSKRVSTIIKDKLKSLGYDRFKYVCCVTVGQQLNQSIKIASRFVWDARRDTWFDCTYSNRELFAVATVYVLYYE